MQQPSFASEPAIPRAPAWGPALQALSFLFDAFHNGLLVVDRDGTILVYNQAAGRVMKKDPATVVGRPMREVLSHAWPDIRRILKTGVPQIGVKFSLGESTIVANRTPVLMEGRIVGAASLFQDISEYERIITELETYRRITRELDAIINSSYDGLYITDGKANTLRVNQAYERISGLPAELLVGRNMRDLVREGYIDQSATLEVLRTRSPATLMQDIRGKKVMVTGNPIFDDSGKNIILVVTNVRDVTELDTLRRQLENSQEISEKYYSELQELRLETRRPGDFVVKSEVMQNILRTALKVADVDTTLMITGEPGVGKGFLARFIHDNSRRCDKPFLKINCGAIPEGLLESELFGYTRGAFTGASPQGKLGLLEVAEGGTVLLDEISELPVHLQVKLLSVLEDKQVTRLGSTQARPIDVRIIAASNRDLGRLVEENRFRQDLFFRLNIIPLVIPPLRDRREDIFPLAHFFLNRFNQAHHRQRRFSAEALDLLLMYAYPGNVRELQNIVERLVIMSEEDLIGVRDLPLAVLNQEPQAATYLDGRDTVHLKRLLKSIEARLIQDALRKYGSTHKAAPHLRVSQSTLARKARKYGLTHGDAVLNRMEEKRAIKGGKKDKLDCRQ